MCRTTVLAAIFFCVSLHPALRSMARAGRLHSRTLCGRVGGSCDDASSRVWRRGLGVARSCAWKSRIRKARANGASGDKNHAIDGPQVVSSVWTALRSWPCPISDRSIPRSPRQKKLRTPLHRAVQTGSHNLIEGLLRDLPPGALHLELQDKARETTLRRTLWCSALRTRVAPLCSPPRGQVRGRGGNTSVVCCPSWQQAAQPGLSLLHRFSCHPTERDVGVVLRSRAPPHPLPEGAR